LPVLAVLSGETTLMSPRAMGEFIVRAADAFGLERPHVVGPDVGTSAALFAAAGHPDRFSSIVVGTGGAAVPLQLGDPCANGCLLRTSSRTAELGDV
jgi:pimeloyl-ACP methyl ester carboxylesterase